MMVLTLSNPIVYGYSNSEPYLTLPISNNFVKANAGEILQIQYVYYYKHEKEKIDFSCVKQYSDLEVFTSSGEYEFEIPEDKDSYYYSNFTYTINTSGLAPGNYHLYATVYYYKDNKWVKSTRESDHLTFYINGTDADSPASKKTTIKKTTDESNKPTYSDIYRDEWMNGKWYDENGKLYENSSYTWHKDSNGWWFTRGDGKYAYGGWLKVEGRWYYFNSDGYMAQNEWRDNYWLGNDGAWTYSPKLCWHRDSNGWWVQDSSGWYPVNKWQKIDGYWYYFDNRGYMTVNKYVDGYWLGIDGTYY
jgi:Putative cell wall binding repeat.